MTQTKRGFQHNHGMLIMFIHGHARHSDFNLSNPPPAKLTYLRKRVWHSGKRSRGASASSWVVLSTRICTYTDVLNSTGLLTFYGRGAERGKQKDYGVRTQVTQSRWIGSGHLSVAVVCFGKLSYLVFHFRSRCLWLPDSVFSHLRFSRWRVV